MPNPIEALSEVEFRELLRLSLLCERHERKGIRTTTAYQMQGWLDVLDGVRTKEDFVEKVAERGFFDKEAMEALKVSPLVAMLYLRVARDCYL